MDGGVNFINYCYLYSGLIFSILAIAGDFDRATILAFLIFGYLLILCNINDFNKIERKLNEVEINYEIEQLTEIIDNDLKSADAYFLRGEGYKGKKDYLSAFRDYQKAKELEQCFTESFFKEQIDKEIQECREKISNRRRKRCSQAY